MQNIFFYNQVKSITTININMGTKKNERKVRMKGNSLFINRLLTLKIMIKQEKS